MDNEDKSNLLNLLFEIPKIGGIISLIILLGPLAILVTFTIDYLGNANILVFSIAMLLWLRFLENAVGIRMLLPIPIINIPWIWFTWAGILLGVITLFE
ncbi:MAG: hypothetical protein HN736_05050 [Anaerolineae bacterium]|jgi:hypothetical protein|nr:hypothetical protein [Anaerolineae bacterium]MBT4312521.1 hypothetical protein [Anaerolineae bacterium]MBT4457644.1 hypothetical protein [Anaerolineae bacterium]MBT4841139.1 hypothetical protein [Anaerolineae bacterium]MBT6062330.1 hypothetical protein [Anaerolineae bacterium]